MSKESIAIRTYYLIKNASEAEELFPAQLSSQMKAGCQRVLFRKEVGCSTYLNRVPLQKPLYLLRVKKRYTTQGQVRRVVKAVRQIGTLFATKELPDFVSTATSLPIYGEETFQIENHHAMDYLKSLLHESIAGAPPTAVPFETRPHCYLKDYSLIPPKYDLFRNRIKQKISSGFASHSIRFEDPVPCFNHSLVPANVQASALYALLKEYLGRRPCWLKNVLLYTLRQQNQLFSLAEIKSTLKYLCYTYKNGPWKFAFCAFGFNPNQNDKAVMYQTIVIKLKEKDIDVQTEPEFYDPSFRQPCSRCIGHYQLCDVEVEAVQNILRGKLLTKNDLCNRQYGWLTASEHSKILKAMKDYVH